MKSRGHFHFKQFSVGHDRSIHKVGTDGVLLGAWVNIDQAKEILDIGTGSGVIALMLAQRSDNHSIIDAIEIEKEDADQALENVKKSPWPQKVSVYNTSLQDFNPGKKYDLIVSNPPYFINSWLPSEKRRSQARHTQQLKFEELIQASLRLLKENGTLAIILPYDEGLLFMREAETLNLFCNRKCAFRSRDHKPIERLLMEFSRNRVNHIEESLTLYEKGDSWSDKYRKLTAEFYLKS